MRVRLYERDLTLKQSNKCFELQLKQFKYVKSIFTQLIIETLAKNIGIIERNAQRSTF